MATKLLFVFLLSIFAESLVFGQSKIPDSAKCLGCVEDFGAITITYLNDSGNPYFSIEGDLPNANITKGQFFIKGSSIMVHFFVRDLKVCKAQFLDMKSLHQLGIFNSDAKNNYNLTTIATTMLIPFNVKNKVDHATIPIENEVVMPYYLPKEVTKCDHFELILYFMKKNAKPKDAFLTMGIKVNRKNGEKCATYKKCPSLYKLHVATSITTKDKKLKINKPNQTKKSRSTRASDPLEGVCTLSKALKKMSNLTSKKS